jgi:hypothetical protein
MVRKIDHDPLKKNDMNQKFEKNRKKNQNTRNNMVQVVLTHRLLKVAEAEADHVIIIIKRKKRNVTSQRNNFFKK